MTVSSKDLDLDLEVQTIINESAETLERNLRADMNINLDLLMTYLKREKKDFKPRKYKKELLENIELKAETDTFNNEIEEIVSRLKDDAEENEANENYLIISLYIYRYLIWCVYKYGFQPFFAWELYRGLKLCMSFRKSFENSINTAQKQSNHMRSLAQKRHEETRKKDIQTKDEIKNIWLSHNWASYTECADHIHKNALVDESNYRKIYTLVSKAAKEKS